MSILKNNHRNKLPKNLLIMFTMKRNVERFENRLTFVAVRQEL